MKLAKNLIKHLKRLKIKKIISTTLILLILSEQFFFNLAPVFAQDQQAPQVIPQLSLPFHSSENHEITLKFGEEEDASVLEKLAGNTIHQGIDFAIPEGTDVLAVDDGEIIKAGDGDFGITVKVKHAWGDSVYGHLSSASASATASPSGEITIETPKKVSKGELIGLSGSTGISTGPHLHLGIKNSNAEWVDPLPYLTSSSTPNNPAPEAPSATESATIASPPTATESGEIKEPIFEPEVLSVATDSASEATQPTLEDVSQNPEYLFNYKFNLNNENSVHFQDKATQRPSFAVADKDYNHKLRFFLKDASSSASPTTTEESTIDFPVTVSGIPMKLVYTMSGDTVKEEFVIAQNPYASQAAETTDNLKIAFDFQNTDLKITKENQEYSFKSADGSTYWKILAPTLEDKDGKKGTISAELNEDQKTYTLNVDSDFLKTAVYPVTIDPTVILSTGFTEAEAQLGGQQRKIVAISNSVWYAFYNDASNIYYQKSTNSGSSWDTAVSIGSSNTPIAPSIWYESSNSLIYVAWLMTSSANDKISVRTINTASSDTLGTACTTADVGEFRSTNPADAPSIAVVDDLTVYVAVGGTETAIIDKLVLSGCTFTNITTGSGLTVGDVPALTTIGNNLHIVNQDGTLAHGIYNGTSWTQPAQGLTELEAHQGSQQRKIVYMSGVGWYAVYEDFQTIYYKKSSDGITWGSPVALSTTGFAPSAAVNGTNVYIAWSSTTSNTLNAATIDTSNSDSSSTCTSGDVGNISEAAAAYPSFAVTSNGATGYFAIARASLVAVVYKLTFSGCTFTNISTGGSLTPNDFPTITTMGNNMHMIFQDGNLSHSAYNGTDWTTIITANTTIISDTDAVYSLTNDGTNLWLLTVDDSSTTDFFKWNGSTWDATLTPPWTSQTNLTSVSLSYDSTNNDLIAMAIKDSSEQAYFMTYDIGTSAWGSETSFGFTAGDLGHISSPETGAGTSTIASTLRNSANYMFSNLTPTTSTIVSGIDGDTDSVYSLTTDGTDLWLLTVDGTDTVALYKFTVSTGLWTSLTSPWTGQANLTSVSLSYDSTNTRLYAFAIKDTSEQAYFKSTSASSISWGSDTSLAFTAGDLGHISSPQEGAGGAQIAVTLRQNANYEFSLVNQDPTAPTSLGPTALVNASFGTSTQPTPTFTLADPDSADTVKYQIQIDDSSDFSSAVVDYTSALAAQGSTSFTVGQSAGSGSYTTGSSGQTLSDGSYYWRVKTIDINSASSAYSTANSGGIAFKVDTTAPSVPTSVASTDHTTSTYSTDNTISMSWTAATDTGGSGVAGYSYTFDTTATTDPDTTSDTSSTTATSGTLSDGASHYFHIRTVDSVGNPGTTVHSGPYYIDTTGPSAPGTPSVVTTPTTDTTPSWSWTASSDSGSGLASSTTYTAQWCTSSSFSGCSSNTSTSTTNSFTHSTALADGTWYLRVKAKDAVDNESSYSSNGTVIIDTTVPDGVTLDSPADGAYTNNQRPTFRWKSDASVTRYRLNINNGTGGDISIDNVSSSGTEVTANKYYIKYENFTDSDSTNNYISLYTKSSSDWAASENDGKLRDGKRTWEIIAYDSVDNATSGSRTLYADATAPSLSDVKTKTLGEKNDYWTVTNLTISGKATDTLAPDKIEVYAYKENYFLGILISTSLSTTFTHSLDNTTNKTSVDFEFIPTLDFGKYAVIQIAAIDKAGNKSKVFEFKKVQYLSESSAKQLFAGEKAKLDELKKSQISIPGLEKQALLRRGKETAELTKLMQDITKFSQSSINNIGNFVSPIIAKLVSSSKIAANIFSQIAYYSDKTGQTMQNTYIYITSATQNISSNIFAQTNQLTSSMNKSVGYITNQIALVFNQTENNITQTTSNALNKFAFLNQNVSVNVLRTDEQVANQIAQAQGETKAFIASLVPKSGLIASAITGLSRSAKLTFERISSPAKDAYTNIFKTIAGLNDNISGLSKRSGKTVSDQIAQTQEETNKLTINFQNSISRFSETILSSPQQANKQLQDSQEQAKKIVQETFSNLTEGINGTTDQIFKTVNDTFNNSLNQSNKTLSDARNNLEQSISQNYKDSSVIIAKASEGVRLAFVQILKPVNEANNFVKRLNVGLNTFYAIVFDDKPTTISNVTIEKLGSDYAVVSWETNHYATGKVNYGDDLTYGEEVLLKNREKIHKAKLTNLKPGIRYYFEVMSQNKNYAYDAYYSFETIKK